MLKIRYIPKSRIVMFTWALYDSPADYPGKFVVRRFAIVRGEIEPAPEFFPTAVVDSLEEARSHIPLNLARIPATYGEDPVVVEEWL